MKVLIIGNGFDLAHGLPTKYGDFLTFCKTITRVFTYDSGSGEKFYKNNVENLPFPKCTKDEIYAAFESRKKNFNKYIVEFNDRLNGNVWYDYFTKLVENKLVRGANWIDFEREIRDIIKYLDETNIDLNEDYSLIAADIARLINNSNATKNMIKLNLFDEIMSSNLPDYPKEFSIKDLRERLYSDLRRLARALEIYIGHFVSQIECQKIESIEKINPDCVISFNYSDTYARIYSSSDIYYIHGKAEDRYFDISEEKYEYSLDMCNLVLGIDEYWNSEKERAENIQYTIFKKFAQRILFGTGEQINLVLGEMEATYNNRSREAERYHMSNLPLNSFSTICIFGHSLDVTDKDILSKYIGAEFTNVDIYCKDAESEGELLANTISLIGEQLVLEKVYSAQPRIRFII